MSETHNFLPPGSRLTLDDIKPSPYTGPVLFAKGAMYGYCPYCAGPGIRRDPETGTDTCEELDDYPSMEAAEHPLTVLKERPRSHVGPRRITRK